MSGSKINVAKQALDYIKDKLHPKMILGIGTGTTVNFFIEELKDEKHNFAGAVSSSEASSKLLSETTKTSSLLKVSAANFGLIKS